MFVHRVTLSGVDHTASMGDYQFLMEDWQYLIEFGILLSPNSNRPRYPDNNWLTRFVCTLVDYEFQNIASFHWCGNYVHLDETTEQDQSDDLSFLAHTMSDCFSFNNQINYRSEMKHDREYLLEVFHKFSLKKGQLVIPVKDNIDTLNSIIHSFESPFSFGYSPRLLYDNSGGRGKTPSEWPDPLVGLEIGYAGGIRPENIHEVLEQLETKIPHGSISIDLESGLRDQDDNFDVDSAYYVLETVNRFNQR